MILSRHHVAILVGDMTNDERDEALTRFREGKDRVLIATNVLSRGIDIRNVSLGACGISSVGVPHPAQWSTTTCPSSRCTRGAASSTTSATRQTWTLTCIASVRACHVVLL